MTPFERNIEVWRQLWRVLERSHLIVQIVDARNPLRFRCQDLEDYIQDVKGPEGKQGTGKGKRKSLLLINKADLLTAQQRCVCSSRSLFQGLSTSRRLWADYFDSKNIRHAFFSAVGSAAMQQARRKALEATTGVGTASKSNTEDFSEVEGLAQQDNVWKNQTLSESDDDAENELSSDDDYFSVEEDDEFSMDPRARVLSVSELEDLLLKMAPPLSGWFSISSLKHLLIMMWGRVQ